MAALGGGGGSCPPMFFFCLSSQRSVMAIDSIPTHCRSPAWAPHRRHMYHMNNFESLAPKDDSCHVWLKSNHAFSKGRWNSYFLQRAHRGLLGPPWELPWTTFILHLIRYLHTTWLDHSPSGSGEEDVWNLHGFGPLGPSPWAPMGATHTIWTTLNPLPLRMIPAKFG